MKQSEKNLYEKRIKVISNKFQDLIKLNKIKNDAKSKNLINKIISAETKARIFDNKNIYERKIEELNNDNQKKIVTLKRNQVKFSDYQIKIQKFLVKYPLYRNLYSNFNFANFAVENIELIKNKQDLYSENLKQSKKIKLLNSSSFNKKNNISIIAECYLIIKDEELKNIEKKIENIKEIIDKVKYNGDSGSVINLKSCDNGVDDTVIICDKSTIVNNEVSKDQNECNDLSVIIRSNFEGKNNIFYKQMNEENYSDFISNY